MTAQEELKIREDYKASVEPRLLASLWDAYTVSYGLWLTAHKAHKPVVVCHELWQTVRRDRDAYFASIE